MTSQPAPAALPADFPRGVALLHDPLLNRGTGFTEAERRAFDLNGLLPPRVLSMQEHAARILENFHKKPTDLEKYVYMSDLEDRNETLFYRILIDNLDTMMPIVYTPTVGQACQQYGHIFRRPRGLFISARDRGHIADLLRRWPNDDIRVIVVTDGERILGLGDLGANGMGIPGGKLSLYTACAGIHPSTTLPITLDVGTENPTLLDDPLYIGLPQHRLQGEAYDSFIDEFMQAVTTRFPDVLVQFEDFANHHAFALLERYRTRYRVFNDDIQGTAAVTLAGLLAALRLIAAEGGPRRTLAEQRLLFLGAGEAGVGIADLVVSAMVAEGLSPEEARQRCWFVDSKGLVVRSRADLAAHKLPYAHDHAPLSDLAAAVNELRPTAIIGVSGQPRTFTRAIIESMGRHNERPIIFALSNPTSKSECTAEEAYTYTNGRAIFASGSPFPSFTLYGKTYNPGQGNNAYIFPGVGLGVVVSGARHVTDEMFGAAAHALAEQVTDDDMAAGRIYPVLSRIRDVSAAIAAKVAEIAWREGLATQPRPDDPERAIRAYMYDPQYTPLV
ncbi:MAG: NAD-dependent malic enzyme [Anaerolineae bacterium]|uniref:NAD-dependent malic enzyme n=1 Tax=Promineifilum sp. TaxID=2664178 RepID=UPI001D63DCC2|nr:NAD-dependent malic enzyme [Anaerolineales bacterium]MCO5180169.1 NAD-dependent malic enzyme [Promineifilum sp.]MCW5848293.1 NAD-dependent malic enzyme [Anaerolineae bacterium]